MLADFVKMYLASLSRGLNLSFPENLSSFMLQRRGVNCFGVASWKKYFYYHTALAAICSAHHQVEVRKSSGVTRLLPATAVDSFTPALTWIYLPLLCWVKICGFFCNRAAENPSPWFSSPQEAQGNNNKNRSIPCTATRCWRELWIRDSDRIKPVDIDSWDSFFPAVKLTVSRTVQYS